MWTHQLKPETLTLIERLARPEALSAFAARDEGTAEEQALLAIEPYLIATGASQAHRQEYRWFARELLQIMRTAPADEITACFELLIGKWAGFGLPSEILELQTRAIITRLLSGSASNAQ
ncbi:MAG: hypothetical protein ABIK43_03545 [candidate division WOR-3 bacterium]